MAAVFTFIKDYSAAAASRYFLTDAIGFREVSAGEVASYDGLLISHDYWMICEELYCELGKLPAKVVDLDEFRIFASKKHNIRGEREKLDITHHINKFFPSNHLVTEGYRRIFHAKKDYDGETVERFHQLVFGYYIEVCRWAFENGEFQRFFSIEVPCQELCAGISARGIPVRSARVAEFRAKASHEYYSKLKGLSDVFDVPLQIPSNEEVADYALLKKVDISQYSLEFVINYLPQIREFAEAVIDLRNLSVTRKILDGIAVKSEKVHPIVDTQGSRTSRISVRNPYLQGLARGYRNIIVSSRGKQLCYVDFDQFEVGIMAALSRDPELLRLYAEPDMYESFRNRHLGSDGERATAKILFLAYAYGMKRKDLPFVAAKFGVGRDSVRNAFKSFSVYEKWKRSSVEKLDRDGFVATSFGNRFYKSGSQASSKERLSAISQIVQGEGSLIFKKTLLKLSAEHDVEMLLPMHDALLFQHARKDTPSLVRSIFEKTMTAHFDGQVRGKASVDNFFESEG